jgi:hypothetical protein
MADAVVAQVRGTAAEREVAYVHLLELEAEHFAATGGAVACSGAVAEIAVACVCPLCEVMSKPVSEVDVAEFQRAAQVLTALQVRERASAHDHASVAHPYLSHPIFDSSTAGHTASIC